MRKEILRFKYLKICFKVLGSVNKNLHNMSKCSIVMCGARKNRNQPQLTLHRFPRNEALKRKWLEAIGQENINPRHKDWFVCSLHFEERCFNRTLDVIRLRDNSLPTIFPFHLRARKDLSVLDEKSNINMDVASTSAATAVSLQLPELDEVQNELWARQELCVPLLGEKYNSNIDVASTSAATVSLPLLVLDEVQEQPAEQVMSTLQKTCHMEAKIASKSAAAVFVPPLVLKDIQEKVVENEKIKALKDKCLKQQKKIKRLNEKLRRKDKKIANMKDIIEDLRKNNQINMEQAVVIEDLAGSRDFLIRQVMKSKGLPLPSKYSEDIRKFALTLHFLSPKAYNYVRQKYNTCLPHTRTLSKWYQHVDAEPGFTKEAFDTLKIKAQGSECPIICSLVFDEMAIRKSLIWDPRTQKYHGRVDYGLNLDSDSVDEASQALVLMLTCINGAWKLPIGYFLITSLTGEQKSVIVDTALKLCDDVGVKVVSITCDGPAANFSMFASLGCDILKNQDVTNFERGNTLIHCFIDPCHALKLIRNAFGELKVFIDPLGRNIDFKYLELLLDLQEKKGLHLGNKIKKQHIFFHKQKMKVKLATQIFSSSVADSIDYCRNNFKLKEFENSEGTVNFINLMNDLFDILNSHSIRPPGFKKAMCPSNIGIIRAFFEGASGYLNNLKLPSGELLIKSRRKTGFIAMLINIKSALSLYEYMVENAKILKYIPLYKISQDHLELFFSAVRARGGFNNNPNAIQFRAAYKKLLVRAELRDDGLGNCTPLEQISILTCSSKNPIKALNELTDKENFAEIIEDHSDLFDSYMDSILSPDDIYTDRILEYIAGFVTKKLLKNINCDICTSLLLGEEDRESLIFKKSRGGLKYASYSVIEILKKAEKLLKIHLNVKSKPELYYLYIFKFMCEVCDYNNYFSADTDPDHTSKHKLLLIKSILKIFLDIRFKYHGKIQSENVSHRQFLNKLILFRNE